MNLTVRAVQKPKQLWVGCRNWVVLCACGLAGCFVSCSVGLLALKKSLSTQPLTRSGQAGPPQPFRGSGQQRIDLSARGGGTQCRHLLIPVRTFPSFICIHWCSLHRTTSIHYHWEIPAPIDLLPIAFKCSFSNSGKRTLEDAGQQVCAPVSLEDSAETVWFVLTSQQWVVEKGVTVWLGKMY